MTKDFILSEIRRTAVANGGKAPGVAHFRAATGIREHEWRGVHWARWADAVTEAGLRPNRLQPAFAPDHVLTQLALLVRELGHWPTVAEQQLRRKADRQFPDPTVFRRFGGRRAVAQAVADYCSQVTGYEDVRSICMGEAQRPTVSGEKVEPTSAADTGFVYLLRAGRYFKVGRTNSVGRRERELAIQLPVRAQLVHSIRTDDPVGIEAYWHGRFASKRGNGEWFDLSASDVAAFRRRKFM